MEKTKDLPTGKEFPALWAQCGRSPFPPVPACPNWVSSPLKEPPQASAVPRATKSPSKALQAYQRGLTASPAPTAVRVRSVALG